MPIHLSYKGLQSLQSFQLHGPCAKRELPRTDCSWQFWEWDEFCMEMLGNAGKCLSLGEVRSAARTLQSSFEECQMPSETSSEICSIREWVFSIPFYLLFGGLKDGAFVRWLSPTVPDLCIWPPSFLRHPLISGSQPSQPSLPNIKYVG